MKDEIADSLRECFVSANVEDSNGEAANLVDTTNRIAAIIRRGLVTYDENSEPILTLVEAVDGIGQGISGAIERAGHEIAEALLAIAHANDEK